MSNIESVKQKILQLDAGSFQNLCDAYLCKIGYPNIVSLGGEAGTRKTTFGTPDTYFYTADGKYIFVEYTTKKAGLAAKIEEDLQKCLDTSKTGISHDMISEIIYCHTSSNITAKQDHTIRTMCAGAGIRLTVIGIDKLAEDLYLFYPGIARDFLGISMTTDQIEEVNDFVKGYNAVRMAAPLNYPFLFRDPEMKKMEEAFRRENIVVLSGAAGVGKTRLALHYATKYADAHHAKLYCIHSNALPIYEDLKLYIDRPGEYFLFVDDANQLSGLEHVIRYAVMDPEKYPVKILITVRDYALQKVTDDIRQLSRYEMIPVNAFTTDEIKELVKSALGIKNLNYLDRIAGIAEGNARLAILAGREALASKCLDSINDVSQLYDDYYGTFFKDDHILAEEKICITAGIVAFLEAVHLDHLEMLLPILEEKGLGRDLFLENIYRLHREEIVDIYHDRAVRFSDQCLANYLVKYVFYDRKLLSLSAVIEVCFLVHRERTIWAVNTLLSVFRKEDLYNFVETEVRKLWKKLAERQDSCFFDFVRAFFRVDPTETLLLLRRKIELEESVSVEMADIDTEKGKNDQFVKDDMIEILGGFAYMEDLPAALDLFFSYYLKRPDRYMEFYHAANQYFGIGKDSEEYGFYPQILFLEKMAEYGDHWQKESIAVLFLEIAGEFLKLHFSPAEGGPRYSITIYQIPLRLSEGVKKYRGLIWEALMVLGRTEEYRERVRKVLRAYGGMMEEISFPVMEFDLSYIEKIMEACFPPDTISASLLAEHLLQVLKRTGTVREELFAAYFETESFRLYVLLKGPDYEPEVDVVHRKELKQQKIGEFLSENGLLAIRKLTDIVCSMADFDDIIWEAADGLATAFDLLSADGTAYPEAIRYYIGKNTPGNLYPCGLLKPLFSACSDQEIYRMISEGEYDQKNGWLYAYYHELPADRIEERHLRGLYTFLAAPSDREITSSAMRDVDFMIKYDKIDKDAFVNGCRLILEKADYSPYMVHLYFGLLFNPCHNTPQELLKKFEGHYELLEDIYCTMLSCDINFDYNGVILSAICRERPSVADRYTDYLADRKAGSFRKGQRRNRCFWNLEDCVEIYNRMFDRLLERIQFPEVSGPRFLESILMPVEGEGELEKMQGEWIRQCIQCQAGDRLKMYCLFEVIAKWKPETKKEYIRLFLENNESFEAFQGIPLTPVSWSHTGSAVPVYSGWIDYLEALLPEFAGLKWIEHKKYVEAEIRYLKKQIEEEEIREILRG